MARKLKSDKWLFGAAFFLVCVSVVMVYSALAGKVDGRHFGAGAADGPAGDVGAASAPC